MIEQYPFFVYGTLIPDQPNDHYWQDCIGSIEDALFQNGRLFDMGSFPMLIEGGNKNVAGKVMYPRQELSEEAYQLLVQRLDTLENYDPENIAESPYYRVLRTVLIRDTQPIKTWVYLGRQKYTAGQPLIPGGDWVNYCAGAQSKISIWWEERGQNLLFGENTNQTDAKD